MLLIPLKLTEQETSDLLKHQIHLRSFFEQGLPIQSRLLNKLIPQLRAILLKDPIFEKYYQENEKFTRFRLIHDNLEILALPWHTAFQDDSHIQIETSVISIKEQKAFQPTLPLPLKVLVMVSGPEDLVEHGKLSFEEEEELIIKAFGNLIPEGKVLIDYTDDGSLESLRSKLEINHYHVLHFSGHGFLDSQNKIGYLLMEDSLSMNSKPCSAQSFARVLKKAKYMPHLVVLSACRSGQSVGNEQYASISQQLVEVGVPAVIGMRYSIIDAYASNFTAYFYKKLSGKAPIPEAFKGAIQSLKEKEDEYVKNGGHPLAQWLIPQLLLGQEVIHIVDWEKKPTILSETSMKFVPSFSGEVNSRLLLKPQVGYRFIGRRRERKEALRLLKQNQPVLFTGMGGVGKTALAENLVTKFSSSNPNTQLFFLNEKPEYRSLDALSNQVIEFLEKIEFTHIRREMVFLDSPIEKFRYLLSQLELIQQSSIVFVFDNLESFQVSAGSTFSKKHQDIYEAIEEIIATQHFALILTSRYPLLEIPEINNIQIRHVALTDTLKKCHTLQLKYLAINLGLSSHLFLSDDNFTGEKIPITFFQVIESIHQTLGGNYRAIELFDQIYKESQGSFLNTLRRLTDFKEKLKNTYKEQVLSSLQEHARSLVIKELLELLTDDERLILNILSQFNVPVSIEAVEKQQLVKVNQISIERLSKLTCIERLGRADIDENTVRNTFFDVPVLIKSYLRESEKSIPFYHHKAGEYFESEAQRWDDRMIYLEEAFGHYQKINQKKKIESIGEKLTEYFFDREWTQKALFYGMQTASILGSNTPLSIHNRLGQLYQLIGNLDQALLHFEEISSRLEEESISERDRWESSVLNNLGLLYFDKGNLEKAKEYLHRSLDIDTHKLSREEKAVTLSNLSTVELSQGNITLAETYLNESLEISRRLGQTGNISISLTNMAEVYSVKGDLKNRIACLEESIQLQRELGTNRLQEADSLVYLADVYLEKDEYSYAISALEKSLGIYQKRRNRKGEANIYNALSAVYGNLSEYEKAIGMAERSIELCEKVGDIYGKGRTLFNLGYNYFSISDFEKAQENMEMALDIAQQIGDKSGTMTALNGLGELLRINGDTGSSIEYFEKALGIAETIKDKAEEVDVINNIARNYMLHGRYEKAIELFQKAFKIQSEIGNDVGARTVLNNIGQAYIETGRWEEGATTLAKVLAMCREVNDLSLEATVLIGIAQIHEQKGEFDLALQYLEKALKICERTGDKTDLTRALNQKGHVLMMIGKDADVLHLFERCIEISTQSKDMVGKASALNNLGTYYDRHEDYEQALIYYEQAYQLYVVADYLSEQATCLSNIGLIYYEKDELEKAESHYIKSLEIQTQIGDEIGRATNLNKMAGIKQVKEEFDIALSHFEESLSLFQKYQDPIGEATVLNNLGYYFSLQSLFDKTEKYYLKSLKIREEIGDALGLRLSYYNLSNLYVNLERFEEAVEWAFKGLIIYEETAPDQINEIMEIFDFILEQMGKEKFLELIGKSEHSQRIQISK